MALLRAVFNNPSSTPTTGVLSASFDLPTGLCANAAALQGWRVRLWDGSTVDVTWWEPFAPHPGGSVMQAVAQWVGTLPANSGHLTVEMVRGANRPPSFVESAAIRSLVSQSSIELEWTDNDPHWTPANASEREFRADVLRLAREGEVTARPGFQWKLWQDRGLTRVYRGTASIGRGHHHDWLDNQIPGLLIVHAYLLVQSGSEEAWTWFQPRNTATCHGDSHPPANPNNGSASRIPSTQFPLVRYLQGLRVRFGVPGYPTMQFRPIGTLNPSTGDGPCPIRRLDGETEGKLWDLNIDGLGLLKRYPFAFAIAWGADHFARVARAARYPYLRYGWSDLESHREPLRIGNFAGTESAYGIAAGGWEIPPAAVTPALIAAWRGESESRLNAFLAQTSPGRTDFGAAGYDANGVWQWRGHCPIYNSSVEQPNDPWNVLGYPADPGGAGGAMPQFGWLQEGRALYGHSHGDLLRVAVAASRFLSMQIGTLELRDDERTNTRPRNPGTIPHTVAGFAWGDRDTYFTPGSDGPDRESGMQGGRRESVGNQAQRPYYPNTSTRAAVDNPDAREAFPTVTGGRQRWARNNPEHWGIRPGWIVVRMVQDPMLWAICQEHADSAFYASPDGYFPARTLRGAGDGGGTRARKRLWRTMINGGWLLTRSQRYIDRLLEMVWRMDNDASGNNWLQPFQVVNIGRTEVLNLRLNGEGGPAYNQERHHDYAWQTAQAGTFFVQMAYLLADQTGATPAYPAVTNLRELAVQRIAEIARQVTYKFVVHQIGIPADRLGLTPRTLDRSIDWSDPTHTWGFFWHRYQGYGAEVQAGEGGQPATPNRLLGGITSGRYWDDRNRRWAGRPVEWGGTGEEVDFYPLLKAARIWYSHPDFDADVQARIEYIIGRLEALEPGLVSGSQYDSSKGYACGEWVTQAPPQPPSILLLADPASGDSPLRSEITARGFAPVDPSGATVEFWFDWADGSTAPADTRLHVGGEAEFTVRTDAIFTARPGRDTFRVRALLRLSDGRTAEAFTQVRAADRSVEASFELIAQSGISPVPFTLRSTTAGNWSSLRWHVYNDAGDTVELPENAPEVDGYLIAPGKWSFELVAQGSNTSTARRLDAVDVYPYEPANALGEISALSGSAPLTVTLVNLSNYPGTLHWGTGDTIDTLPGDQLERTFASAGTYRVYLTARGPQGEVSRWTAEINVDTLAVHQDVDLELPVVVATASAPDFLVNDRPEDMDLTIGTAAAKGLAADFPLEVEHQLTLPAAIATGVVPAVLVNSGDLDQMLAPVLALGITPELAVEMGFGATLGSALAIARSMGISAATGPTQEPRALLEIDAQLELGAAVAAASAANLTYSDRAELRTVLAPAIASALAALRYGFAAAGGEVAEVDLGAAVAQAIAPDLAFATDTSAFASISQIVRDAKFQPEIEIVADVAEAQENITGFVRGSARDLVFPIKANGVYVDPDLVRRASAHIHIFANRTSTVPLVTMIASVQPDAAAGPRVYYKTRRGDTAGLAGATNYFYRVELEFPGDDDVPILSGTFGTADQPAMRDDER